VTNSGSQSHRQRHTLPDPIPTPPTPSPGTQFSTPNSPNSVPLIPRTQTLKVSVTVARALREAARGWPGRRRITGYPGGGRPPILSEYIRHLLRVDTGRDPPARAVRSPRDIERTVRIARSVARWAPQPHPWNAKTPVPGYRQALLLEWPKESDGRLRHLGRDGLTLGVVAAMVGDEVLDPTTVTPQEIPRLAFIRSGDAGRAA
jgi:hypothetical protein